MADPLCQNMTAFKTYLGKQRKYDDSIALRMNRVTSMYVRDKGLSLPMNEAKQGMERFPLRTRAAGEGMHPDDCIKFWEEIRAQFDARTAVCQKCLGTEQIQKKTEEVNYGYGIEHRLARKETDTLATALSPEHAMNRRQIKAELEVESIIRQRTIEVFLSHCPAHDLKPAPKPLPQQNATPVQLNTLLSRNDYFEQGEGSRKSRW